MPHSPLSRVPDFTLCAGKRILNRPWHRNANFYTMTTPAPEIIPHSSFRSGLMYAMVLLLLAGCRPADQQDARPVVVTSIAPIGDWIRNITGDAVDVLVVVPPNASPHTFELQPRMLRESARASLVVLIGNGFESWADKLVSNVENPEVRTLLLTEGADIPALISDKHGDHVHAANPHVWLDPVFAAAAVERISTALVELFPDQEHAMQTRAAAYRDSLHALHRHISVRAQQWIGRAFIGDHSSWVYFARRYGIKQAGVIENIPGREVSARTMGSLIDMMRKQSITAIFSDIRKSSQAVEILAEETDARIAALDPLGSERTSFTYLGLMRYNVREIDRVLQ